MKVTWRDRWKEWQTLDAFVRQHEAELVAKGRMRAMTLCMQRTWQDMMRLKKQEGKDDNATTKDAG